MIAGAQCFIEVYPYEGTPMQLQAPYIRSVEVTRNIRETAGAFQISLRPGGPGGVDSTPTWTEIITPMSLVLIGMRRGSYSQIIMVGVVTASEEAQVWQGRRGVERVSIVSGTDFSYFFNTFNYYTLGFLGMTAGAVTGEGSVLGAAVALPSLLGIGYTQGRPDEIGVRFYNQAMVGSSGVLAKTFVPYRNNARLTLQDMIGTYVQPYGSSSSSVYIPDNSTFVTTEGSWTNKFLTLFPFPFYEFFVGTAPLGYYGATQQSADAPAIDKQQFGYPFWMQSLPDAQPSSPCLIARVNPTPTFKVTSKGFGQGFQVTGIDADAWNALPLSQFADGSGLLSSRTGWSVDEVRNFYLLNPVAMRALAGDTNTATVNFGFATTGAADPASINRYGYRPEIVATNWFYDPNGTALQNPLADMPLTVATLLGRVCTHHEPTPFMVRAEVALNLRPDILIGTRFRYAPFKAQPSWDFYVEGVGHRFDFEAGQATTSLNLSRGLPSSIYADASPNGLLQNIHLGNAQRTTQGYQVGLPSGTGTGLVSFGSGPGLTNFLGQISPAFSTPQALPGN